MKRLIYIVLGVFIVQSSVGQNPDRTFEKITETANDIQVLVNDGTYHIQFYNQHIVETSFIPKGESFQGKSHAVVMDVKEVDLTLTKSENFHEYKTKGISISIQKEPFQISYAYKGNTMISEKKGYVKNDSLETIQFNLKEDEVLYGGGARALGMNRRGNRLELYNKADYGYETRSELMNFTLPIVMSSQRYMVHFDNAPIGF